MTLRTCCQPISETDVLGREVDGPLVLADGIELQDAFDEGFRLVSHRLHTDTHLQDTSDPCDMRACPDKGGTCTDALGSNCNCNGRACVLHTELSSKEELIKVK